MPIVSENITLSQHDIDFLFPRVTISFVSDNTISSVTWAQILEGIFYSLVSFIYILLISNIYLTFTVSKHCAK